MLDEEIVLEEEHIIEDEGFQSALDCTTCKNSLVEMEESYKQQIAALELKLICQQNRIDKYYNISELTDDEENVSEGKGGKGCNLALKKQYLGKIKCEKRRFRFLQLDHKTQLMICKIDALRESRNDHHFIDELLEMFERNSMQLQRLNKTIEEMKEVEDIYIKARDDLMHHHEKVIEEKEDEIDYFRMNMKVVLVGNEGSDYLGESSKKKKNGKKCKKHLETNESVDDYRIRITKMEGLRELDDVVYNDVVKMLGWQK